MSDLLRRICLNPKVVGALILVAVLLFVFAPSVALSALPLLLVAACPLSMLLVGGAMIQGHRESADADSGRKPAPGSSEEIETLRAEVEALRARVDDNSQAATKGASR